MTYNARIEADKLLDLLREDTLLYRMSPAERGFVLNLLQEVDGEITEKQVLWLRDLAGKYA